MKNVKNIVQENKPRFIDEIAGNAYNKAKYNLNRKIDFKLNELSYNLGLRMLVRITGIYFKPMLYKEINVYK